MSSAVNILGLLGAVIFLVVIIRSISKSNSKKTATLNKIDNALNEKGAKQSKQLKEAEKKEDRHVSELTPNIERLMQVQQALKNDDLSGEQRQQLQAEYAQILKHMGDTGKELTTDVKEQKKEVAKAENQDRDRKTISKSERDAIAKNIAHQQYELDKIKNDLRSASGAKSKELRSKAQKVQGYIKNSEKSIERLELRYEELENSIKKERDILSTLNHQQRSLYTLINGLARLEKMDEEQQLKHIHWLYYVVREVTRNEWYIEAQVNDFLKLHEQIKDIDVMDDSQIPKGMGHTVIWEDRHTPNKDWKWYERRK